MEEGGYHPISGAFDQLGTLLNTAELAQLFQPPKRQVSGVHVRSIAQFNLNPPLVKNGINLGRVVNYELITENWASIPLGI